MSAFTDPRTSKKIRNYEKSEKAVAKFPVFATTFLNPGKGPKTQKVPEFKQLNRQKFYKLLYHG
jgi:hypothetical protein